MLHRGVTHGDPPGRAARRPTVRRVGWGGSLISDGAILRAAWRQKEAKEEAYVLKRHSMRSSGIGGVAVGVGRGSFVAKSCNRGTVGVIGPPGEGLGYPLRVPSCLNDTGHFHQQRGEGQRVDNQWIIRGTAPAGGTRPLPRRAPSTGSRARAARQFAPLKTREKAVRVASEYPRGPSPPSTARLREAHWHDHA